VAASVIEWRAAWAIDGVLFGQSPARRLLPGHGATIQPKLLDPAVPDRVVRNDEEQYSIYRVDRDLSAGWLAAPAEGTREECLAAIGMAITGYRG